MPLLVLLLLILAARALTLPGAAKGLEYYLEPDFSRALDVNVLTAALGQAFFSLSLGMGALITYGSYLRRTDNLGVAALWVILLDTAIALLAGFIIFPTGFSIRRLRSEQLGTRPHLHGVAATVRDPSRRRFVRRRLFHPSGHGGVDVDALASRGPGGALHRPVPMAEEESRHRPHVGDVFSSRYHRHSVTARSPGSVASRRRSAATFSGSWHSHGTATRCRSAGSSFLFSSATDSGSAQGDRRAHCRKRLVSQPRTLGFFDSLRLTGRHRTHLFVAFYQPTS